MQYQGAPSAIYLRFHDHLMTPAPPLKAELSYNEGMSASQTLVRPSERLRARRDEVLEIIRRSGAENPRVFGSVARGTDTVNSDIDLLVRVPPGCAWNFLVLAEDLSDLLGVRVDVVSERGLKPKHAQIIRDAKPL